MHESHTLYTRKNAKDISVTKRRHVLIVSNPLVTCAPDQVYQLEAKFIIEQKSTVSGLPILTSVEHDMWHCHICWYIRALTSLPLFGVDFLTVTRSCFSLQKSWYCLHLLHISRSLLTKQVSPMSKRLFARTSIRVLIFPPSKFFFSDAFQFGKMTLEIY